MRICFVHSQYRVRGGEEVSLETDVRLLREHGHDVAVIIEKNADLDGRAATERQSWSRSVYSSLWSQLGVQRFDVVHFQNTQYAWGPTAIHAASDMGLPVVVALSNERLRFGWRDVIRNPLNQSMSQSVVLAASNTLHRRMTWQRKVDRFIAASTYIKGRYADAGFPFERISVKPDTVYPTPEFNPHGGDRFLFAGRLTKEKGLGALLAAWRDLSNRDLRLQLDIVGACPTQPQPQPGVTYHGALSHADLLHLMGRARAVIVPSIWPEPSGRIVFEAMACGTPVIASSAGGISEGRPRITVLRDSVTELQNAVRKVAAWSPSEYVRERLIARAEWEKHFAPERQLEKLLGAYQQAIAHPAQRLNHRPGKLDDPSVKEQLARYDAAKE